LYHFIKYIFVHINLETQVEEKIVELYL